MSMSIPVRHSLIDCLPLASPFSIHIFPTFYCNFSCNYCIHGLTKELQQKARFIKKSMSMDIYKLIIDSIKSFSSQPKSIIFAGHGEPLLHPEIAEMVSLAKQRESAERVEIVTNGSLLNPALSDKIINAGLDRLRISLQGLNAEDYKRVCGVKIDFPVFLSNLEYFYKHKQHTEVFIKIIDIALNETGDAERFHAVFDRMCDTAVLEYLFPFIEQIDHNAFGKELNKSKHGGKAAIKTDICAMPFYMLVILPNGDVTGCCAVEPPIVYGNITQNSLTEIWNCKIRAHFLYTQVYDRKTNAICRNCTVPCYGMQEGDYLDEYKVRLQELFKGN